GRIGEVPFLRAGALLMTVGLVSVIGLAWLVYERVLMSPGAIWPLALLILTILVTGFAFMTPSVQSLISRRTDPAGEGEVVGVNQSAAALARILGPMFGPVLFFVEPAHVLPYVFGGVLMGAVYLLTRRVQPA